VEKICNRPDVKVHRPDASPYYGNCVQLKCNRPVAALFRKENQRFMESRLHSSLSGWPQLAS
jgi:hypothetical protein